MRFIVALLAAILAGGNSNSFSGEVTVREISQHMQKSYERFRDLPSLHVKYVVTYEHLSGERRFALDRARVETRRRSDKLWLQVEGFSRRGITKKGEESRVHEYAWDGKKGTAMEGNEFYITKHMDLRIYYYNFYVDFLGYPEASGQVPKLTGAKEKVFSPWLPRVLSDNLPRYVLSSEQDKESGKSFQVVTRQRHEAFWFEPFPPYYLRRRDSYNPENGSLKTRTYFDKYQQVGGAELPMLVVREEYDAHNDISGDTLTPTGRKTLKVEELDTDVAADFVFGVAAPLGVTVHDPTRGVLYTATGPGVDSPIIDSAERARANYYYLRPSIRLIGLTTVGVLILLLSWRWRRIVAG